MRIKHVKYGLGVILEEFVSGGGAKVARVIFDFNPDEERTILRSVLSDSKAPMPEVAKAIRKRKPKVSKVERVSDKLLVPELDEATRLVPDYESGFESYTESV
jgi:hypothetical protein